MSAVPVRAPATHDELAALERTVLALADALRLTRLEAGLSLVEEPLSVQRLRARIEQPRESVEAFAERLARQRRPQIAADSAPAFDAHHADRDRRAAAYRRLFGTTDRAEADREFLSRRAARERGER